MSAGAAYGCRAGGPSVCLSHRRCNVTNSTLQKIQTQPLRRNLALTQLGLNVGFQIVAHSLRNILRPAESRSEADRTFYRRQGQVLAQQLGSLKGGVMKAGQLLALYGEYFLPPEVVESLDALQNFSSPVAWPVMEAVLRRQLGRRLQDLDIDPEPLGAASLGQVHRARLRGDPRELCLKIQYPGVADAIESDISTLARIFTLSRVAPRGLDLRPIFGEIRQMLRREVDYRRELRYTDRYGLWLAADPCFVVPQVLRDYSTPQVLTMTFEHGLDVHDQRVQSMPQARRDRLGRAFVELFLQELFGWRTVQTDPNFGNYRFRPDAAGQDRVVLLDFGATRSFTRSFVRAYADIVRGATDQDSTAIVRGAVALGILRDDFPPSVLEGFARMCKVIGEPFADRAQGHVPPRLLNAAGGYRWADSDLPTRAGRAAALSSMTMHYRLPPNEILFLHRRLTGMFMMLAALRAEIDVRPELLRVLSSVEGGRTMA